MIENETSNISSFISQGDDNSDRDSIAYMPQYQIGRQLADHPRLRQAWSDDESILSSSKFIKKPSPARREISVDSTVMPNPCNEEGGITSSFAEWLNYTNKLTDMVSKQIQGCTTGAEDDCDDNFKLKDEEFFWNPNAQSFDTYDTSRVAKESFSKWGENIQMWRSDRNGFSTEASRRDYMEKRESM